MANPKKEFIGHVIIGIIISGVWFFWTTGVAHAPVRRCMGDYVYIGSQSVDRLPEKERRRGMNVARIIIAILLICPTAFGIVDWGNLSLGGLG